LASFATALLNSLLARSSLHLQGGAGDGILTEFNPCRYGALIMQQVKKNTTDGRTVGGNTAPVQQASAVDVSDSSVPILLNSRAAARALSISARTLWAISAPRGDLRVVRIGRTVRFDPRDLTAFADSQKGQSDVDG